MTDRVERLKQIFDEIGANFDVMQMAGDSRRARSLADCVGANRPVRVIVVGEFNSGKSTLVNALCGMNVLPAGIVPTTATINVVQHSPTPGIQVLFKDGTPRDLPYAADTLQQFTAKHGDQQEIREVRVSVPALPRDLVLVDTPGVNDINQTRSEIVYGMIPEADAVIFLMDVQQPLKRSEADFLRDRILGMSVVKTVFVLNHIDRVANPSEIQSAVEYVRKTLGNVYRELAQSFRQTRSEHLAAELARYAKDIPIFTISARQMLRSSLSAAPIEGDPDGLRAEVLALATPEGKIATILAAAVGQAHVLLARLRREADDQLAMYGADRDRLQTDVRANGEVLRKTLEATEQALAKLESAGPVLKADAERDIDDVFSKAASVLQARIQSEGIEKGIQSVQQEIARGLESRMEGFNDRIRRLAMDCTSQAASFIPVRAASSEIRAASLEAGPESRDWLADVLTDPVNQMGVIVLAPIAVILFGWVGFAAIALPFVARLFGTANRAVPIEAIQSSLAKSAGEVKTTIAAAVDERLAALSVSVLDVLDEPQERIRSGCAVLAGEGNGRKEKLEGVRDRAIRLQSGLADIATASHEARRAGLVGRLSSLGQRSLNVLRTAAAPVSR